jgi:hypothetical protein
MAESGGPVLVVSTLRSDTLKMGPQESLQYNFLIPTTINGSWDNNQSWGAGVVHPSMSGPQALVDVINGEGTIVHVVDA